MTEIEAAKQRIVAARAAGDGLMLRNAHMDAFNEYGVQIMSPNYEADSDAPKIVPRDKWFAAPAAPPSVK